MANSMKWTTALPVEPGWYFWEPNETTEKIFWRKLPEGIYRLELCGLPGRETLHLALPKDRNRYPAKWMGGRWAGPIPEPED